MASIPHPDDAPRSVKCAVVTVSDSRTPETDRSGQLIQSALAAAGHDIADYCLLPDEPSLLRDRLQSLTERGDLEAIVVNGGTGIALRDTTYDVVYPLLEKVLPGFGEIFRFLSYQEIGSRAIASRSVAGVYRNTLIFCLPGSSGAVSLALDKLILPELVHLTKQLRGG